MGRARAGWGHRLANAAVIFGCALLLGGFVLGAFLYQPYTVPTDSMAPAVAAGDRVLAERIDGDEAHRGDVVVFHEQEWGDLPMIKRVVGIGGDRVACCDDEGMLTVNGVSIDEPYLEPDQPVSPTGFDAQVPEDELFLLGDQRLDSVDSLTQLTEDDAGTIPRDAVSARVEATVWPPGSLGLGQQAEGFAELPGGVSGPGPLRPLVSATVAGAVLILLAALSGPLARRVSRSGRSSAASGSGAAQ